MNTPDPTLGEMVTGPAAEDAGIRMCEVHHVEVSQALDAHGVTYSKTEEELATRIHDHKWDPLFDVTRILMTLALKSMGSDELMKLRCPVCAFKNFDYIAMTVNVTAERYRMEEKKNSRLVLPPERKVRIN